MESTQVLFVDDFEDEVRKVFQLEVQGEIFTLSPGKLYTVGRDASCDIVIQHKTVSSKHASIETDGIGAHEVLDVGSTNKTFIGNRALKPNVHYFFDEDDVLKFGDITARIRVRSQLSDQVDFKVPSPAPASRRKFTSTPKTVRHQNNLAAETPEAPDRNGTDHSVDEVPESQDVFGSSPLSQIRPDSEGIDDDIFLAPTQPFLPLRSPEQTASQELQLSPHSVKEEPADAHSAPTQPFHDPGTGTVQPLDDLRDVSPEPVSNRRAEESSAIEDSLYTAPTQRFMNPSTPFTERLAVSDVRSVVGPHVALTQLFVDERSNNSTEQDLAPTQPFMDRRTPPAENVRDDYVDSDDDMYFAPTQPFLPKTEPLAQDSGDENDETINSVLSSVAETQEIAIPTGARASSSNKNNSRVAGSFREKGIGKQAGTATQFSENSEDSSDSDLVLAAEQAESDKMSKPSEQKQSVGSADQPGCKVDINQSIEPPSDKLSAVKETEHVLDSQKTKEKQQVRQSAVHSDMTCDSASNEPTDSELVSAVEKCERQMDFSIAATQPFAPSPVRVTRKLDKQIQKSPPMSETTPFVRENSVSQPTDSQLIMAVEVVEAWQDVGDTQDVIGEETGTKKSVPSHGRVLYDAETQPLGSECSRKQLDQETQLLHPEHDIRRDTISGESVFDLETQYLSGIHAAETQLLPSRANISAVNVVQPQSTPGTEAHALVKTESLIEGVDSQATQPFLLNRGVRESQKDVRAIGSAKSPSEPVVGRTSEDAHLQPTQPFCPEKHSSKSSRENEKDLQDIHLQETQPFIPSLANQHTQLLELSQGPTQPASYSMGTSRFSKGSPVVVQNASASSRRSDSPDMFQQEDNEGLTVSGSEDEGSIIFNLEESEYPQDLGEKGDSGKPDSPPVLTTSPDVEAQKKENGHVTPDSIIMRDGSATPDLDGPAEPMEVKVSQKQRLETGRDSAPELPEPSREGSATPDLDVEDSKAETSGKDIKLAASATSSTALEAGRADTTAISNLSEIQNGLAASPGRAETSSTPVLVADHTSIILSPSRPTSPTLDNEESSPSFIQESESLPDMYDLGLLGRPTSHTKSQLDLQTLARFNPPDQDDLRTRDNDEVSESSNMSETLLGEIDAIEGSYLIDAREGEPIEGTSAEIDLMGSHATSTASKTASGKDYATPDPNALDVPPKTVEYLTAGASDVEPRPGSTQGTIVPETQEVTQDVTPETVLLRSPLKLGGVSQEIPLVPARKSGDLKVSVTAKPNSNHGNEFALTQRMNMIFESQETDFGPEKAAVESILAASPAKNTFKVPTVSSRPGAGQKQRGEDEMSLDSSGDSLTLTQKMDVMFRSPARTNDADATSVSDDTKGRLQVPQSPFRVPFSPRPDEGMTLTQRMDVIFASPRREDVTSVSSVTLTQQMDVIFQSPKREDGNVSKEAVLGERYRGSISMADIPLTQQLDALFASPRQERSPSPPIDVVPLETALAKEERENREMAEFLKQKPKGSRVSFMDLTERKDRPELIFPNTQELMYEIINLVPVTVKEEPDEDDLVSAPKVDGKNGAVEKKISLPDETDENQEMDTRTRERTLKVVDPEESQPADDLLSVVSSDFKSQDVGTELHGQTYKVVDSEESSREAGMKKWNNGAESQDIVKLKRGRTFKVTDSDESQGTTDVESQGVGMRIGRRTMKVDETDDSQDVLASEPARKREGNAKLVEQNAPQPVPSKRRGIQTTKAFSGASSFEGEEDKLARELGKLGSQRRTTVEEKTKATNRTGNRSRRCLNLEGAAGQKSEAVDEVVKDTFRKSEPGPSRNRKGQTNNEDLVKDIGSEIKENAIVVTGHAARPSTGERLMASRGQVGKDVEKNETERDFEKKIDALASEPKFSGRSRSSLVLNSGKSEERNNGEDAQSKKPREGLRKSKAIRSDTTKLDPASTESNIQASAVDIEEPSAARRVRKKPKKYDDYETSQETGASTSSKRKSDGENAESEAKRQRDSFSVASSTGSRLVLRRNSGENAAQQPRRTTRGSQSLVEAGMVPTGKPSRRKTTEVESSSGPLLNQPGAEIQKPRSRTARKPEEPSGLDHAPSSPDVVTPRANSKDLTMSESGRRKRGKTQGTEERDARTGASLSVDEKPAVKRGRSRKLERSASPSPSRSSMSNATLSPRLSESFVRRASTLKPKVAFTGYDYEDDKKALLSLGGVYTDCAATCTVLVTDRVKRTCKFLCTVARGKPIVSPLWIHESKKSSCLLDPNNFIVEDRDAQAKFSFNLKQTLIAASRAPLLSGQTVIVTASVKPPPEDMQQIIQCAGGQYLHPSSLPRSPDPNTTWVVSCPDDKSFWSKAQKLKLKVVAVEALLSGLLRHCLDLHAHELR